MLLVACSDGRTAQMLSQIDTLMNDHPDSALAKLDSLKAEKANWPKNLRMRFDLLEAKAQNKAFVDFTTDSIAKEFTRYYDSHGTPNERMLAHYLLGCVYRDLGEAPVAVDCYLDAISQADTTARDCDFYILSCAYAQMAQVYHMQLLFTYEIEAWKKASRYAYLANMNYYAIYDYERQASPYILINKKDSAELIIKKCINDYLKYGLEQRALQASTKLMYIFVEDSIRLNEVKQLMDNYEEKSENFDDQHNLVPSRRLYFYYKGKYFEYNNLLDSAEYYYRRVYRPHMPFTAFNSMYGGLLSVFKKRNQTDSIAKYAQLYCEVNDSSIAKKDQELTAQMAANYNYNRYRKDAEQKALEAERAQKTIVIILSLVVVSVLLAVIAFIRYKHKKEQELRLIQSPVVQRLKKLANANPPVTASAEDFKELRMLVGFQVPSFYMVLNSESSPLSELEYEVCLLIRTHFSPSDICKLTGISDSYASNIRKRLLKKVYDIDGAPKDFDDRILNIK